MFLFVLSLLPHFLSSVNVVHVCSFFLHILTVSYNSTHAVCYGDCNSEKTQGKFVRLNEGKNSLGPWRLGDNKSTC